ncbi:MAG: hypothetical protein EOP32_03750 [Rhodococcus sp. (in: high G+C Gram-positive bacteria)]|nr:MAG: hypothetical protein EOP32_03750 [Rhodococcus sp. (in: high G+C Gram-positive bacteria)]
MESFRDQVYDLAALLKHANATGDLIGVMQLEARLNELLANCGATPGIVEVADTPPQSSDHLADGMDGNG